MENAINWKRIASDVNGNPRYVCHYFNLAHPGEGYGSAIKRANMIGGRKFHNKQYGGGIVFQSYSLPELERAIADIMERTGP